MDGKEEPKLHQDCSDAACKIIEALDTMERERYANFDQVRHTDRNHKNGISIFLKLFVYFSGCCRSRQLRD